MTMDAAGAQALKDYIAARRSGGFLTLVAADEPVKAAEPSSLPFIDAFVQAFHAPTPAPAAD